MHNPIRDYKMLLHNTFHIQKCIVNHLNIDKKTKTYYIRN